jgi:SAM-dependent methyltransferase
MPERINPGSAEWATFGFEHLQRYHFAARICAGKRVLDAGCGSGYGSEILSILGATHVTGFDKDEESIRSARQNIARDGKLDFLCAEIESQQTLAALKDRNLEVVVALELWEHLEKPATLLELARALLPVGGLLIASTPNALQFSRHPSRPIRNEFHLSEMDYSEAAGLLKGRGFRIASEWEQSPNVAEYLSGQIALWHASWAYRLENALRRILGRPLLEKGAMFEGACESRVIIPLSEARRASCMQFIFVAERLA